ncbi:MAG: FAD-dependent oxidoreductase [Myxococcota bacterium]
MGATRRQMLTALLGAPAAAACRARPGAFDADLRFVDPPLRRGHQLRDPRPPDPRPPDPRPPDPRPPDPPARPASAQVLVLGAGVSGLSAAWALQRSGVKDFVVLELDSAAGGTSLGGSSPLGGYPWGAHYLPAPRRAEQPELVQLLDEMGLVSGERDGEPIYAEGARCATPQERIFSGGRWQPGLVPTLGAAPGTEAAVRKFEARMEAFVERIGEDGRRAFQLPVMASSEDPELLALDDLDFGRWLEQEGFRHPQVRWLADYATRDDFGSRPEDTSAWFGIHYHAARIPAPGRPSAPFLTWPDGNYRLVRHLTQPLGPRLRTGQLVRRIRPHPSGRGAEVLASGPQGQAELWRCERVIYALPGFLEKHLLEGFGPSPEALETSAWLVANLHLGRRPREGNGFELAWDNVLADSRSLGYVVATHQLGPPRGPTTWTWYLPLVDAPPVEARKQLLALDARDAAELVLSDLERAHPDLRRCVERIELRRWGHAMPRPAPGARRRSLLATAPRGVVHFAHSDRSGVGLFEEAFHHGVRAAREVQRALASGP